MPRVPASVNKSLPLVNEFDQVLTLEGPMIVDYGEKVITEIFHQG